MNLEHLEKMKLSPCVAVIDIETEGKAIDAVIATIGCVIKNVFTGEVVDQFYVRCMTTEQQKYRSTDLATQKWWLEQKQQYPDSFNEAFNSDLLRIPLEKSLKSLNSFIQSALEFRPQVMGNGPEFDNAILTHAMAQFDIDPVWDYGCNQSLRTVIMMGRLLLGIDPKYEVEFQGDRHHALNDARHEANYLHAVFKEFICRLTPDKTFFKISKEQLNTELDRFEVNKFETVNQDNYKACRAIVNDFFEEHDLIGEPL